MSTTDTAAPTLCADNVAIGTSATKWARVYGTKCAYRIATDNYEPARSSASGDLYIYTLTGERAGEHGIVFVPSAGIRNPHKAVYLIDDGRTVVPYYVAGWSAPGADEPYYLLKSFPTNYNDDGSSKVRPDSGRPVDMGGWQLGPRTTYHVKISAT